MRSAGPWCSPTVRAFELVSRIQYYLPIPDERDDTMRTKTREGVARAHRSPIQAPVLYRISPTASWRMVTTENVSRSGILFRSRRKLKPGTTLDLRLEFPLIGKNGPLHAKIVCKGEVVRAERTSPGVSPAIAVAIRSLQITRADNERTALADHTRPSIPSQERGLDDLK